MKYSPKPNNVKPLMICIFFLVVSVCSLFVASFTVSIRWLFQLIFLCSATVGIQILLKFVLSGIEYVCDDENLLIYRISGKKRILSSSLSLKYSQGIIISKEEFQKCKENYYFADKYSFTRNMEKEAEYFYFTNSVNGGALIILECSSEFRDYVNKKIEICLKGNENAV